MRRPGCLVYEQRIPPDETVDVFAKCAVLLIRGQATPPAGAVGRPGGEAILEIARSTYALLVRGIWVDDKAQSLPDSRPISAAIFSSAVNDHALQIDPGPAPRLTVSNLTRGEALFKAWLYCTLEIPDGAGE